MKYLSGLVALGGTWLCAASPAGAYNWTISSCQQTNCMYDGRGFNYCQTVCGAPQPTWTPPCPGMSLPDPSEAGLGDVDVVGLWCNDPSLQQKYESDLSLGAYTTPDSRWGSGDPCNPVMPYSQMYSTSWSTARGGSPIQRASWRAPTGSSRRSTACP
jgi:hypothetical protein